MADSYLSGKQGGVLVGGVAYSFGKWKIPMKCGTPKITNWTSGGYDAFVAGIIGATISLECPGYNYGNMPLVVGTTYTFTLQYTAAIFISVSAIVNDLSLTNDVEGVPQVTCGAQVTGSFSAQIA